MHVFKERCIELRKRGYTLSEIVKITGRPKTSVYAHIHSIPLSSEKIKLIREASGTRAKAIALTRRGKSERRFKRFYKWNKNTVSLIAHLIFDGSITRTACIYNNRDTSLLNTVENCMKKIYKYEPKRYLDKKTGVSRIGYFNVELSGYLKTKSIELLNNIDSFSKDLKKEFIRAFFDDEGCVDFRPKKNRRQIRGYQKDNFILFLIQKLLLDLGVNSRVVQPNEVVISKKENLIKFQQEINFSSGIKRNENRSNSIWKKPIEKRVLLEQAINSFKN